MELNKQWLFGCKIQSALVLYWLCVQYFIVGSRNNYLVKLIKNKFKASHKPSVSPMQNLKLILKDPAEILIIYFLAAE